MSTRNLFPSVSFRTLTLMLLGPVLIIPVRPDPARAGSEIHGTVTTRGGDAWTGTIRWDKNENFWDDLIDATKTERVKQPEREEVKVRIFGIRISHSGHRGSTYARFSIPFGHLAWIEPAPGSRVRLGLKNGDVLEVREGADLGDGVRGIVVTTGDGEVKELDWPDLERVDFSPGSDAAPDRQRLYGTVETEVGDFTGYVVWDKDESLGQDVLDGAESGHSHKIPFRDIKSIERVNGRRSRVTLDSGDVLELSGTNDVNRDNRGIDVTVPGLGMVTVRWDEFRKVIFEPTEASPTYGDFDGGRRLAGSVTTRDGETYDGEITWDHDEHYSWESLDGDIHHVEFEVQFENISRIEPVSGVAAKVVLRDGLELELRGSNDVDRNNQGILVRTADGNEVDVKWGQLRAVSFR